MITITGYNEDWPKGFGEIRDCLRSELAGEGGAFEVEHFGSTAVPGLAARPVLDLCVVVPDASGLPALMRGLDRLGYVHERAQRVPGLETFRRKGPDVPFLKHRTGSPYLVGPNGYYLRDPETRKPLIWDLADGAAKPFDAAIGEPALDGAYRVAGFELGPDGAEWSHQAVEAEPAFQKLLDHMATYTADWAEGECDVPAATIRRIADEFIAHPWYSPRRATVLVETLAALDLTQNRSAFIEVAVTAESEDDALFYEQTAELMRTYSDRVSQIGEIVSIGETLMAYTESGTLVIPLAADYVNWAPATAALARTITEETPGDRNVERRELVLSGAASPLARERFEALGVVVTERAFEQLEGESARLSEPSP